MATDWIETNWWFPWASAEEAKVEAFRQWLHSKQIEYLHGNGHWTSFSYMTGPIQFTDIVRPLHPHRALIDQYEPGQEWEVLMLGFGDQTSRWCVCESTPEFNHFQQYRLKPRPKPVDMQNPLDCPFCGGKSVTTQQTDRLDGDWWCRCLRCGAQSFPRSTRDEAVVLWNTRYSVYPRGVEVCDE